jgi:hypothetical protein
LSFGYFEVSANFDVIRTRHAVGLFGHFAPQHLTPNTQNPVTLR